MEGAKGRRILRGDLRKYLIVLPVGLLILGWLLSTPAGLLGKADAIGYAVCHRIDLRSFHLGNRQMPLCARCTGMYLGAMLGFIYQTVLGKRRTGMPPWRVILVLGILAAAFGVDGLNSYLYLFLPAPLLYLPNNTLRLLTGTGMGIAMILVLYPVFNQTVWKELDPRKPVSDLRSLMALLGLAVLLDFIVLQENPVILYPLALVSAAGVLVLLTMVYTMGWLMVLKKENRFEYVYELILPLIAGFGIGLLQIGFLDLLRYLLTGTWEGFHIG